MRETKFIEQNKAKWTAFERILKQGKKDPDELSDLFVQITDDLSYSRTFYPNRSVRVYLNNLAQQVFYKIYKTKRARMSRFAFFWKEELPYLVYRNRKSFLVSLFVFVLALSIGVLSCAMDEDFAAIVLGEEYITMTLDNIERGDPMKVYKDSKQTEMFLGITLNNLRVDFMTFVGGVFMAIGTLAILLYNGIMIGAFQFFFFQQGVGIESALTIWVHGTLEISTIIISGAAGLVLGKGLLFPGTYTRLQAFQLSARDAIKILLGVIPLTIAAGFIEGFLTRYTEVHWVFRLGIILSSLAFILSYFVWYPWQKSRKGFQYIPEENQLPPAKAESIDFTQIKPVGAIFTDVFVFYRKHFFKILRIVIIPVLLYPLSLLFFMEDFTDYFIFEQSVFVDLFNIIEDTFGNLGHFFDYDSSWLLYVQNSLLLSIISLTVYYLLIAEHNEQKIRPINQYLSKHFFSTIFISFIFNAIFFIPDGFGVFLGLVFCPFTTLWLYIVHKEEVNIIKGLGRTVGLMKGALGRVYGMFLVILLITFLFSLLIDSSLLYFYYETISWNVKLEGENQDKLLAVLLSFVTILFFSLALPLLLVGSGIMYSTLMEIQEATSLKERLSILAGRKRIYGMETER